MTHLTLTLAGRPARRVCLAAYTLRLVVLLLTLAAAALSASAQNAHITMDNGYLLYANTTAAGYKETGAQYGWRSAWRHKQLPLTMLVGDRTDLTDGGELEIPAGNIHADETEGSHSMIISGGKSHNTYISLSLPQGYYFTGYRMVLVNDMQGQTIHTKTFGNNPLQMFETDKTFGQYLDTYWKTDETHVYAKSSVIPSVKDDKEYVINRTSLVGGSDMKNRLYFCLANLNTVGSAAAYDRTNHAITIKEFTVYFTPAGDTELMVAPRHVDADAVNFHKVPFSTGRPEVGELTWNSDKGTYQYNIEHVKSLAAHNLIYQEDAVDNQTGMLPETPTSGKIRSDYFSGAGDSHSGLGYFYGLGSGTYYVETPVTATTQNGKKLNVAYRIIGAQVEYRYGNTVTEHDDNNFGLIVHTVDNTHYYLSRDAKYVSNIDDAAQWEFGRVDTDGNIVASGGTECIYCRDTENGELRYLVCLKINYSNSKDNPDYHYDLQATPHIPGVDFEMDEVEEHFWPKIGNGTYTTKKGNQTTTHTVTGLVTFTTTDNTQYFLTGSTDPAAIPQFEAATTTGNKGNQQTTLPTGYVQREVAHIAAFTPTAYTLTPYDKEGNALTPIQVSNNVSNGTFTIPGPLNNDAIKFSIQMQDGAAADARALVRVRLTVEALNPYMNRVDVRCTPSHATDGRSVTQTFTSDDFTVRGKEAVMYVPVSFLEDLKANNQCTFTFHNLYNRYGDETYYGGDINTAQGRARYSFVKSDYYNAFSSLYGSDYTTAQVRPYTDKVNVAVAGTQPFKCNNLGDFAKATTNGGTKYIEDYKFSTADYATAAGTESGTAGAFETVEFGPEGHKDVYLFTSDETRYNIAPTTATQHRAHAYYTMKLMLKSIDYEPMHRWRKVYNSTYYPRPVKPRRPSATDTDRSTQYPANAKADDAMWGLEIWAGDKDKTTGTVTDMPDGQGYMTYAALSNIIHRYLKNSDDEQGPSCPYQVLYVDGRRLSNIVYSTVGNDRDGHNSMQNLVADTLAGNCLFYLPSNQTIVGHNFVRTTDAGANRACQDIVIDDKQPFFAPDFIQVPAGSYVRYTRQVSSDPLDRSKAKGTIMLPFTVALDADGKHTNADGTSFTVYTMAQSNCLGTNEKEPNKPKNYFAPYRNLTTAVAATESNKPYFVYVDNALSNSATDIFSIRQTGARIEATIKDLDADRDLPCSTTIEGGSASGTLDGTSVTMTGLGTYSGVRLAKGGETGSNGYFYFGQDALLNSNNLSASQPTVNGAPFRAFYSYTTPNPAKLRMVKSLAIAFGDNPDAGAVTGITAAQSLAAFTITPRHGGADVEAATPCAVTIATVAGSVAARLTLSAGERRTVTLAPGVYVADGKKITVR